MKVPLTSVSDYLNYQMFAQSIKRYLSNEVTVSILSERLGSNTDDSKESTNRD